MDFELLDGIDANKTDPCTLQFLAAPICLLYKNLVNKMVPIAIQVGSAPSFPGLPLAHRVPEAHCPCRRRAALPASPKGSRKLCRQAGIRTRASC